MGWRQPNAHQYLLLLEGKPETLEKTLAGKHLVGLKSTASHTIAERFNPFPTLGNSLKKQKSLYKVVLNPHINSYGLMGVHDAHMRHWLVKG